MICKKHIYLIFMMLSLFSCNHGKEKNLIASAIQAEKNLYHLNVREYDRGGERWSYLSAEITTTPNNAENQVNLQRMKYQLDKMKQIDKESARLICIIDRLKIKLLKDCGENMAFNPKDENRILKVKYDPENPLFPCEFNLSNITSADETIDDFPAGFLWDQLNAYRSQMFQILRTDSLQNQKNSIQPLAINNFRNKQELEEKVRNMIHENNRTNHPMVEKALIQVYCLLSEQEKDEKGITWSAAKFDHLPLIMVIGNLSMLQNKILAARKIAFRHIYSNLQSMSSSSIFDHAAVLAYGPETGKRNEEITLKIVLAAFETGRQHVVVSNQGKVTYENGIPVVRTKVSGRKQMKIKGTLDFKTRSGILMTYPWEKTIQIVD